MTKLKLLLIIIFLLTACSHFGRAYIAIKGNPYNTTPEFIALGKETFKQNCTSCHGNKENDNAPDFTAGSYSKSVGLTAANIYYGKREMPAFKDTLLEKEIWAVASYIKTLSQH